MLVIDGIEELLKENAVSEFGRKFLDWAQILLCEDLVDNFFQVFIATFHFISS